MTSSKISIITTDLLLIAGLILCLVSDKNIAPSRAWASTHCIVCAVWFALIIIHIAQHWGLTKAFVRTKVRRKNRLTTLTIIAMVLMSISVLAMIFTAAPSVIKYHNSVYGGGDWPHNWQVPTLAHFD